MLNIDALAPAPELDMDDKDVLGAWIRSRVDGLADRYRWITRVLTEGAGTLCAHEGGFALIRLGRREVFCVADLRGVARPLPPIGSLIAFRHRASELVVSKFGGGSAPLRRKDALREPEGFGARVSFASDALARGTDHSRSFDTCFESGDADCVAAALMRRADARPTGLLARGMRRYLGAAWSRSAERLASIPTRKLSEAAKAERAGCLDSWLCAYADSQALSAIRAKGCQAPARRARSL